MIHIIEGNNKIGKTSNISLPFASCPDLPCKEEGCYAIKAYRQYPEVRKAWNDNYDLVTTDRKKYFSDVRRYLLKRVPKYFRWHVAGDILDQNYLENMKIIADDYSYINFLVFTKAYDLDFFFTPIPNNLSIIISTWVGVELPNINLPYAWIEGDERVPKKVFKCKDNCETCRYCWNPNGKNILLKKH